jgi:predicted ATPase
MINKIRLQNFKCFKDLEIELGSLNLFAGLNGMGKSTVIQALLLLRQSCKQGYLPEQICLNGDYVQLGTGRDVLYEYAEKEPVIGHEVIGIEITENGVKSSISIKYSKDADVLKNINPPVLDIGSIAGNFDYLNAERTSPQTIYPKSSYHVGTMHQLGNNGQYTVHYLSENQDKPVPWDSCNGKEKTLRGAVQYWLNEISPNINIEIQNIDNTDLSKIGYYFFDKAKVRRNTFRPTNIGFGVSYVLPVIVALLKATAGSILILENPEAHLHPKGQRKIGELISKCAASGAQVFVETHSDHILNGIRIAAKESYIKNNDICICFFQKNSAFSEVEHVVATPKINSQGKLDFWPDDFFDEWEKALDEII